MHSLSLIQEKISDKPELRAFYKIIRFYSEVQGHKRQEKTEELSPKETLQINERWDLRLAPGTEKEYKWENCQIQIRPVV